jgi:autotransporter translocation and assembly factor TamB
MPASVIAGTSGKPLARLPEVTAIGRSRPSRSTGAIAGQVLTVGKRLSDRVYIAYEQAVTTATYLLRVELELRRFVSLRAEAGAVSGFGIFLQQD